LGSDAVKTKTYFAFRVDVWDAAGDNIVEHVAGGSRNLLGSRPTMA
jgi:hypothetical protein